MIRSVGLWWACSMSAFGHDKLQVDVLTIAVGGGLFKQRELVLQGRKVSKHFTKLLEAVHGVLVFVIQETLEDARPCKVRLGSGTKFARIGDTKCG